MLDCNSCEVTISTVQLYSLILFPVTEKIRFFFLTELDRVASGEMYIMGDCFL